MTVANFRRIALSMPEAFEAEHHGHPDFRVKGKIFATLFPRDGQLWGMVKVTPDQQRQLVHGNPATFAPVKGGWGAGGATQVCLKRAGANTLRSAMRIAWRNAAPKDLLDTFLLMGRVPGNAQTVKPRRTKKSKSAFPAVRSGRARTRRKA